MFRTTWHLPQKTCASHVLGQATCPRMSLGMLGRVASGRSCTVRNWIALRHASCHTAVRWVERPGGRRRAEEREGGKEERQATEREREEEQRGSDRGGDSYPEPPPHTDTSHPHFCQLCVPMTQGHGTTHPHPKQHSAPIR